MADNDIKKTDTHPVPPVDLQDDTPPPFRRVEAGEIPPKVPTEEFDNEDLPVRAPARRGGCGCWIPAILTVLLVGVLAIIGAILPPINLPQRLFGISLFGPNYTMLSAQANAVANNGLALIADPATLGTDFGVVLASVPMNATSTDSEAVAKALAAVPPTLARQSPVYSIETTGKQPQFVTLNVTIPTGANPDSLDMYGWNAKTTSWHFVPSQINTSGALSMIATVNAVPDPSGTV